MRTSEHTTDLLTALCAARLEFPAITRNREGFSKRGGQKYGYADLNPIIDATEPILGAHGLLVVQSLEDGEGGTLRITSTLFHAATGQWLSSEVSVTKPDDMQNFGMAATYVKCYAQQALLNISTEEDDDAASLNGSSKAASSKPATVPASTHGHTPAPEPDEGLAHPTEGHIAALQNLALTECHEDKEVYDQRIRQTMGLKPSASVAPRLLTRTMSMVQYMTVYTYYVKLSEQLAKSRREASRATDASSQPGTEPTPAPTEAPAAVPQPASAGESSSADDTAERERIIREAMDAGIPEKEARHVLAHHDLKAAHHLLLAAVA